MLHTHRSSSVEKSQLNIQPIEPKAPSSWTFLTSFQYFSKSLGFLSRLSPVENSRCELASIWSICFSLWGSARGLSAIGGSETKKVSCISRAGCCWGTKRASKFQKPESTKLDHVSLRYALIFTQCLLASRHLNKALREEDVPELLPDLHQRVQCAGILLCSEGCKVVGLEVCCLPCAAGEKICWQVCVLYRHLLCVLGAIGDGVCDNLGDGDELLLLQVVELLSVRDGLRLLNVLQKLLHAILWLLCGDQDEVGTILLDPLVLEGIALSYARRVLADNVLYRVNQRKRHRPSPSIDRKSVV